MRVITTTTGIPAVPKIDGKFVAFRGNPDVVDFVLWFEQKMTMSPSQQSLILEFREEERLRRDQRLPYGDMYFSAVVRLASIPEATSRYRSQWGTNGHPMCIHS